MQKEQLIKYLSNQPLKAAIWQKMSIDNMKEKLYEARQTLLEVGVSENTIDEIEKKLNEYRSISVAYGTFIEDTWAVTWQSEGIIKRYINCSDDELDELPSVLSL